MELMSTNVSPSNGHLGRRLFTPRQWSNLGRVMNLSDRQLQVIQSIFDDHKELVIGRNLKISIHTVHTHLERLYHKLRVTSRCQLMNRVFAEYLGIQMRRNPPRQRATTP